MTLLPIVARELRVAARRPSTFWGRASAAAAVVVVGAWSFLVMAGDPPATVALTLFGIMTGNAAFYCLLGGLWATADCLSREKRDGTLGLLFLTDLRGYDVVLGKLAATSLNALYGVLAIVPMLAVPLLLGGVTTGEVGRMALVILDTLFLSLTLGICISALSRSARKAVLATLLMLLAFTVFFPLSSAWLDYAGRSHRLTEALLLPSPGFAFATAFDALYKTQSQQFWCSLGLIHGLGWVFLVTASVVAPRSWQDKPAPARGLPRGGHEESRTSGEAGERLAFRRRLLEENAYFWLAARARWRPLAVWAVLGTAAGVWAWGLAKYHREWLHPPVYFLTAGVLNLLIKLWVATEAGRQLSEDRWAGTLELILSTPLSVREILRGQFLALQRQFLGPVAVTLAAFLVFLPATLSDNLDADSRAFSVWVYVAAMISLVADVAALHWTGMWQALTARSPQRAVVGTMARILALPWLGMALAVLIIGLAATVSQYEPQPPRLVALWLALGITTDIGFGTWARHRLYTELRQAAARRFTPPPGFWKRWLHLEPRLTVPANKPIIAL
ncbi:MAG TPA: ABC transporter permease subunit [Dongiaceae bacterium]|nr:ABC transporter permease subunit [Dongiaceae bacterium]